MSDKLEFSLLKSSDYKEFCESVNARLHEGWELHGNLIAFPASNTDTIIYLQAFTKKIILKSNVVMTGDVEEYFNDIPT